MAARDIAHTNVYATNRYIVRRYNGVASVDDMAQINKATITEANKFLKLNKPICMLLDLRGKYVVSFEIYEEALKVLSLYVIEKIAIIEPINNFTKSITEETNKTYKSFIKYRWFKAEKDAQKWLNEA